MYDFKFFEQVRQQFAIPSLPFMDAHRQQLRAEKPWQGLKILHNIPLTLATIFKIEALAFGGADVTVTSIKDLAPEKRVVALLQQAGFKVQVDHDFDEKFDFHLDCCAELLDLRPPAIGAVELTQTGSNLYQNAAVDYPVVSVDDSNLKILETFFGTGDGFARALQNYANDKAWHNQPFVIFGNGKVGRGIIYALQKFTRNISVIDVNNNPSLPVADVHYIDANDKALVRQTVAKAACAVTATGIKGLLTQCYGLTKKDFGQCLLTNMGADDEYGDNFATDEVAFHKKPFNFCLEFPTALHYLDPVFYAHNIGMELILSGKIQQGYHPFPDTLANRILEKWQSIYKEDTQHALTALNLATNPQIVTAHRIEFAGNQVTICNPE